MSKRQAPNKIMESFGQAVSQAEKYNSSNRTRRFLVMTNTRHGKVTEIGIYDSVSKKYALTDVRAYNALDVVNEMSKLMRKA
jgi:hypothetical protein